MSFNWERFRWNSHRLTLPPFYYTIDQNGYTLPLLDQGNDLAAKNSKESASIGLVYGRHEEVTRISPLNRQESSSLLGDQCVSIRILLPLKRYGVCAMSPAMALIKKLPGHHRP